MKGKKIIVIFVVIFTLIISTLLFFLSSKKTKNQDIKAKDNIIEEKEKINLSNKYEGEIESKDVVILDDKTDEYTSLFFEGKHDLLNEKLEEDKKADMVVHIKTPKKVKSIYFTSHSSGSKAKLENLYYLVENTEINSVTIDIKTVSGYVAFDMSDYHFDNIKPVSNNIMKNVKDLIKRLHEKDIYTIARIVVFKDKLLAQNRPDLAIKKPDQKTIWEDYKGKMYLDPYAKEVWDYNKNIAIAAYEIGFDEINFDYIRFPTDGKISQTYYPFSNIIQLQNPKRGKIIVIDKFSDYIVTELKEKYPEMIVSADIFGLVTKNDGFQIGQNLESFLINFDYVGPMLYASHYGQGYMGFTYPDNHAYEILKDAITFSDKRVKKLNSDIEFSQSGSLDLKIKDAFVPSKSLDEIEPVEITKIRPWIQGFSCTRCKNYVPYNRTKFRNQIIGLNEAGLDSWWVWSSSSKYYSNRYNK